MVTYADVLISPSQKENLTKMLLTAKCLGFTYIAVASINEVPDVDVKGHGINGLKVVKRVIIDARDKSEALSMIRKFRYKVQLISVKCNSLSLARFAARDRRVDILMMPRDFPLRFADKSEVKLALQGNTAVEISLKELIECKSLSKVLALYQRLCLFARKIGVPIIISSGATNVYEMRSPRDMISLALLLDMPLHYAQHCVSTFPVEIIERNIKKLEEFGYG